MDSTAAETVELSECRVLRMQPGDIVVFETEDRLRPEQSEHLKAHLERLLAAAGHAGIPTMIISGGTLVTTRAVKA